MRIQGTGRILINSLFRRKKMILALNIGIIGTVLVGTLLWQPAYEAGSTVVIRGRNYEDPLFHQARGDASWTLLMNPREEINSEIEIIRSRPVLEGTVAALGLDKPRTAPNEGLVGAFRHFLRQGFGEVKETLAAWGIFSRPKEGVVFEEAVERLNKKLLTDPAVESQIIRISYRNSDPVLASQVVNKVVELYLQQHLTINLNRSESSFYQEQIALAEQALAALQKQLVDMKTSMGVLDFSRQSKALMDKMTTFDVARTTAQKEIISKRVKVEKVRQIREANPDLLIPLPEIEQDIQVQDLENKLINLRYEWSTILDRYTKESDQVRMVRKQLAEIQTQIRSHVDQLLDRETAELSKLEAEEQALTQTIDVLQAELITLPEKEVALRNLEVRAESQEGVLSVLRKKYQDSMVSQATDFRLENAKVVSHASPPVKPVSPKLWLNLLLGLLFSLTFSFSLAFLMEYMDDTLNLPEDVERTLGISLPTSIPEL